MATITIRNLEESIKMNLCLDAARHGCSMEEEARRILRQALTSQEKKRGIGSRIHKLFVEAGSVDLPLPSRSTTRPAPDFSNED